MKTKSLAKHQINGNCGRSDKAECGLKDSRHCKVHRDIQVGAPERREVHRTWSQLRSNDPYYDPSPSVGENGLDGEINENDEIAPELRSAIEKAIDRNYAAIKCLQEVLDGDSAKRHRRVVERTWSQLQ